MSDEKELSKLSLTAIEYTKKQIISELNISKKEQNEILKKLKDYKYVDEIGDLQIGSFIRWLDNDDKLQRGGILCDLKINDDMSLLLKSFTNKLFYIKMIDTSIIFQKLTTKEKMLMSVMKFINSN
jgi:hypothetical protein